MWLSRILSYKESSYTSKQSIPIFRSLYTYTYKVYIAWGFSLSKIITPIILITAGPRVFSCTNPWSNEADTQWERERERDPFSLSVYAVFTEYFHESGMKRDKSKERRRDREREREGERNRSQVRVHFDNVTTTGCMRRTITSVYIVSAFRFFFLSFFFFCRVNAFGRCIIREIVACKKWTVLPYLVKT